MIIGNLCRGSRIDARSLDGDNKMAACIYVYMYVCMYVYVSQPGLNACTVCMYVCMYVCMGVPFFRKY